MRKLVDMLGGAYVKAGRLFDNIQLKSLNDPYSPMLLSTINSQSEFNRWHYSSDGKGGLGESTANFVWDGQNTAKFSGVINTKSLKKDLKSGFAGIWLSEFFPPLDASMYDCFSLRIKTDGRIYIFNARSHIGLTAFDDLYQFPFKTTPGIWTTLVLPFDKFYSTSRAEIPGTREEMGIDSNASERIRSIGLLIAEQKNGSFELELESISAVLKNSLFKSRRYDLSNPLEKY